MVPILVVVAALLAALASARLGAPARALLLAVVGGGIVATSEITSRVSERHRWPSGPGLTPHEQPAAERAARVTAASDLVTGVVAGVVGAVLSWLAVVTATAARLGGWQILLAGAIATIAAIGAIGAVVSGPRRDR
ncbi:MAG: hypothetical protein ACYCSF_05510 [Acidimicrobiales bacterium]